MEQKYNISKYKQMPVCVMTPGYNNNRNFRLQKNLNSIFTQNYTNFKVVITDDASNDGTQQNIDKYLKFYNISQNKAIFIKNKERKYSGYTMYHAITKYCDKSGITVSVDGDDELVGRHVFNVLNAVYQKNKVGIVWSRFLRLDINSNVMDDPLWAFGYTPDQIKNLDFRRGNAIQHLKSFRTQLFDKIKMSDMQDTNGQFYKFATDVVFYQPMLQIACGKYVWLPDEHQYIYTFNTGANQPRDQQLAVAQAVWAKPKSACFQDFKRRMQAP